MMSGNLVPTYFGNVFIWQEATTFDIPEGDEPIAGMDIRMATGGTLVSKIVKATVDGKVDVNPETWPGPRIWRQVGGDWVEWEILSPYAGAKKGQVATYGLPAGKYRVGFIDWRDDARTFQTQFWKSKASFDSATTVTIKKGETTTLGTTTIIYPYPDWDVEEPSQEEIDEAHGLVSPDAAEQGDTISIDLGEEMAGEWVALSVHSDPLPMSAGWVQVDSKGRVPAIVDYEVEPGQHTVIVQTADQAVLGAQPIEIAEDPEPNGFTAKGTPAIKGTVAVGSEVVVAEGTWKPMPTGWQYQWLLDGEPILDATDPFYTPTPEQLGAKLSVRVTASRLGVLDADPTRTSKEITIGVGTLTSKTPVVSGVRKVDQTLTVAPGDWTDGTSFAYQWYRDGKKIPGATQATYVQVPKDVGKRITVKVSGSHEGYKSATKSSASKPAKTAKAALDRPAGVAITGIAQVGVPLEAGVDGAFGPDPVKVSYQWYVDGKAVKKATGTTFTPGASHVGKRVTVKVKGSKSGYVTLTLTSPKTAKVAKGEFTGSAEVAISGAKVAVKTTATVTGLTPKPSSYSYRWMVGDKVVSTSASYTPKSADAGKTLTVRITAKRAGYLNAILADESTQIQPAG